MKVTLDLDALLAHGEIDRREYDKLLALSRAGTATLAFNILVAFGVVAVAGATLALVPTPLTAVVLGVGICAAGLALGTLGFTQWRVLANVCIVVGALLFAGGVIKLGDGSVGAFLTVAVALGTAGVLARSSMLAVLAVLSLASCLGARTGYLHAMYFLGVQEPAQTVVLFAALAAVLYQIGKRVPLAFRPIAIAGARAAVFVVNFGFWIGSLWGDRQGTIVRVPDWAFALGWALALIAAGVWAWRSDRRWLVNVVAVFGAIHFYTQWFERLGATPISVLVAGGIALAIALALRTFNAREARA